jgi:hypothetical protein
MGKTAHVCTPTCGHAAIGRLLDEWEAIRLDLAMGDIAHIDRPQLLALDPDGRPCEICGGHLHHQTWADIDHAGIAVACSEQATGGGPR